MQCQYCHFTFKVAGHYGRHLRAKHPNESVGGLNITPLDPHELSVVTRSKRGHNLSSTIVRNTQEDLQEPTLVAQERNLAPHRPTPAFKRRKHSIQTQITVSTHNVYRQC